MCRNFLSINHLQADFTGVSFKEGQISKAYARNSKFIGCDFTNAVVDRASFDGSDLSKSIFANAVLSGTSFKGANLADTDFTDAYLGPFDLKNLCLNPTLVGTNPVSPTTHTPILTLKSLIINFFVFVRVPFHLFTHDGRSVSSYIKSLFYQTLFQKTKVDTKESAGCFEK